MYSCVWTGHRYSCQWTGHVYIYSHLRTGQLITLAYGPPRCSCTYYGLDSGILWTYTVKSPMDRTAESLTCGQGKWIPLPKDMTSIYSCLWTRQLLQTGNSWKFAFRLYTLTYLLLCMDRTSLFCFCPWEKKYVDLTSLFFFCLWTGIAIFFLFRRRGRCILHV